MTLPAGPSGWRLVPRLLLRRAGFPFDLLAGLPDGTSARRAAELHAARSARDAQRASLLRQVVPAEVKGLAAAGDREALRALSRWRSRIGRGRWTELPGGPWSPELASAAAGLSRAQARVEALTGVLAGDLAAEAEHAGAQLAQTLTYPGMRLALLLLSPDFAAAARRRAAAGPAAVTARERAFRRRLLLYLQRLCAKNETTSFFGPITHGRVDERATGLRFGPRTPSGVRNREGFLAFWAVQALATAAAHDAALREELPVRLLSTTVRAGDRVTGPTGRTVRLSPEQRVVLDAVDGARDIRAIARAAGVDAATVARVVDKAEAAGLVGLVPEPLSTVAQPVDDLIAQLQDLPAGRAWVRLLAGLREDARAFAGAEDAGERQRLLAGIERRFSEVTGEPARRAGGAMYADRAVVFEDCSGDRSPFTVGGDVAARWERELGLVLDLGATLGQHRHRAVRLLSGTVVDELGGEAPYLDFIQVLQARIGEGALEELAGDERAWLDAYAGRVAGRTEGTVARLRRADVADLVDVDHGPRFASPDVLVDTSVDPHRLVLGEVHPYVYAWGSQGLFAGAGLQRAFDAVVPVWGGRQRLATVLRRRRHKGLVGHWFPGRFVEVSGLGSREGQRRLRIADLRVRAGDDGPELVDPAGVELCLYTGEEDHPHLAAFAPPGVVAPAVSTATGAPRVTLDGVVIQRAEWRVDGEVGDRLAGDDAVERAVAVAELRDLGVPRWAFLHARGEPKPICVDLDNPLFHEVVGRFAGEGLRLREALPPPAGLLPLGGPGAFTSEFRVGMWRA